MSARCTAALISTLFATAAHAAKPPSLEVFDDGGSFGYRDAKGNVVIPARYLHAGPFSKEGLACVVLEGEGWQWIGADGRTIAHALNVDNDCAAFSLGKVRYARIERGGKFGYMDRFGTVVIAPTFDWAEDFEGGTARACVGCVRESLGEHARYVGGAWGTLDASGAWVEPPSPATPTPDASEPASPTDPSP